MFPNHFCDNWNFFHLGHILQKNLLWREKEHEIRVYLCQLSRWTSWSSYISKTWDHTNHKWHTVKHQNYFVAKYTTISTSQVEEQIWCVVKKHCKKHLPLALLYLLNVLLQYWLFQLNLAKQIDWRDLLVIPRHENRILAKAKTKY